MLALKLIRTLVTFTLIIALSVKLKRLLFTDTATNNDQYQARVEKKKRKSGLSERFMVTLWCIMLYQGPMLGSDISAKQWTLELTPNEQIRFMYSAFNSGFSLEWLLGVFGRF